MGIEEIQHWIEDSEQDLWLFTGQDDAIIGVATQFTKEPCVIYSLTGILNNLMEDGMTHEEAQEFYSFNIEGAWYGDQTPYVLQDLPS